MRTALLTLTLLEALAITRPTQGTFSCFDTPDNGPISRHIAGCLPWLNERSFSLLCF